MNKKKLIRIISFVLVICLLVPIIPDLGIDLFGVTANAASTDAKYFKAGSKNYGYWDGTNSKWAKGTPSYEAFALNGVTYIPTELIAAAFGTDVATLKSDTKFSAHAKSVTNAGGETVECIEAIDGEEIYTGYYINISNMNLIAIDTTQTVFDGMSNDEQILLMKNFLFDHLANYVSDTDFDLTSEILTTSSSYVTSLSHPYIMADQTEFDYLYRQWSGVLNSGETQDAVLKGYLDSIIEDADGIYAKYANSDGSLNTSAGLVTGQTDLSTMPYSSNYGYDTGGRQGESGDHAKRIATLAYAYQVTHLDKYASLALYYAEAISSWQHWGVGHFLNAADASAYMALAYDWCYTRWGELDSTKRTTVRDALFTKGVVSGVLSSYRYNITISTSENSDVKCPWYNPVLGQGGFIYQNRDNNWNGVCSSGMILASLALMAEKTTDYSSIKLNNRPSSSDSEKSTALKEYYITGAWYWNGVNLSDVVGGSTIGDACVWLINNNLCHLEALGLRQYIPDGSYIESATYWSYGTNSIMRASAALRTALGTDFGLSSGWGLDNTALFSYYVQSSDGDVWKYHDHGGDGALDTSLNGLYGAIIGNDNITAYRKYLIEKGVVSPSMYDTFMYDAGVDAEDVDLMPLDYYMEGIQGYSVRDSWERGSIYAAFMGGDYIINHGQLDSGAFVYYNNGVRWFEDIGCDNYNVEGYGYGKTATSLRYYPTSAEGNNTIATDALQYGQYAVADSSGNLTAYGSAEITAHKESGAQGSYAILDQTAAFTGVASSARRGMLFTYDRTTLIIQDEITFNDNLTKYSSSDAHTAYWFAHVKDSIEITLSADGKTAYLTDGDTIIRCSLISGSDDTASAVFTVKDCAYSSTNMVLDGTDKTGTAGGTSQKQYDAWQKLTVACQGVKQMKIAVVIEELAPGDNYDVGYKWTDMSSWDEVISSNSDNYDGKLLLSKNFDDTGSGSFESESGNFRFANTLVDGDNAMGMYNTSSSFPSSMTLAAAEGKVEHSSIGDGLLVAELDIKLLEELTTTNGSARLELWGTDIYPNVSLELSSLGLVASWNRVSIVIDEATDNLYVYVGNDLRIVDLNYRSRSYENLKLVINSEGSYTKGKLLIDNVVIRTYTESYTGLDKYMSDSAQQSVGISSWQDSNVEYSLSEGNVARLYTTDGPLTDTDTDSPIIDFWTANTDADETNAQASISSDYVTATSISDLETKINSGAYKYAELIIPVTTKITINAPITVDTCGYKFYATAPSLICSVNGDTYTYRTGTVRVTYVVGGVAYTTDFTGSVPFSMSVGDTFESSIVEGKNDDGSYRYVQTQAGCWANKAGGEILDESELIVTTANAKFYLTGDLYIGDFVVVGTDGTITGHSAEDFTAAYKAEHKRISVTRSFYIDNSDKGTTGNDIYTNTNIYLNGYTITYYTSTVSDHMFAPGSNETLNVYGPGTISIEAPQSNLLMQGNYAQTNFNNLNVVSIYNLTDIRFGTCSFNNCNITSTSKYHALSTTNRTGGVDNSITDKSQMGILRINGGSLNYSGTECVVYVKDNSRLILEGGVTVNAPSAKAAISLEQSNGTDISNSTKGNIESLRVYIGEVYFNVNTLFKYAANVTCTESSSQLEHAAVFKNNVFYIEGAAFATDSLDYPVASTNGGDADVSYTVGEHVLARTGSAGYEWIVVRVENAAYVTWQGDTGSINEYWADGSVPYAKDSAKALLNSGNAYNMYSLHGGTVEGGESYTFPSVAKASLDIRMSVALNSDFRINFFIEKVDSVNYIMVNGERVETSSLETVTLSDKEYYVAIINDIAPANADQLFSIVVNTGDGVHVTAVSSILNYAEYIMKSATSDTITLKLKRLMSSIVKYIGTAAAYSGDRITEASCNSLVEAYGDYKNDIQLNAQAPNTSDVSSAIRSAYLELGAKPNFAFRFRLDFTGSLKISYVNFRGTTVTETVKVSGGIVEGTGDEVYRLAMKAYDMGSDLTLTAMGEDGAVLGSCSFDLGMYYTMAASGNDELYRLLSALEAYAVTAREYTKERNGVA